MRVWHGLSTETDARKAVDQAVSGWGEDKSKKIGFILYFHSTKQDADAVARRFDELFPGIPVAGCTTSGELLNGKHYNGALVVCGVEGGDIKWSVGALQNMAQVTKPQAEEFADQLCS